MLKRSDWFWIILALVLTWAIDRWTKLEALSLTDTKDYGFLLLSLHFNPGAILGLFSQLPPVLRIVTLSTGGAFLIFTYFILQYLIPARAMPLRIGMSLLLGGIIGNVADRIAWGHVVDFISFRIGNTLTPIFNIADAIQWVGHGMIMVSLFKNADLFWPESNVRKTQWINLRFQLKYCFILMVVGLGMGIIAGTFSYTYLRVTLLTLTGENEQLADRYLIPFILSLGAINGIFMGGLYLIGKLLSLRVAGPVYAFERYIEDLLAGNFRAFQVRGSDEFQDLTTLGIKLKDYFYNQHLAEIDRINATKASVPTESLSSSDAPPTPPSSLPTDEKRNMEENQSVLPKLIFTPSPPPQPSADAYRKTNRTPPPIKMFALPPLPQDVELRKTPATQISTIAKRPPVPPPAEVTESDHGMSEQTEVLTRTQEAPIANLSTPPQPLPLEMETPATPPPSPQPPKFETPRVTPPPAPTTNESMDLLDPSLAFMTPIFFDENGNIEQPSHSSPTTISAADTATFTNEAEAPSNMTEDHTQLIEPASPPMELELNLQLTSNSSHSYSAEDKGTSEQDSTLPTLLEQKAETDVSKIEVADGVAEVITERDSAALHLVFPKMTEAQKGSEDIIQQYSQAIDLLELAMLTHAAQAPPPPVPEQEDIIEILARTVETKPFQTSSTGDAPVVVASSESTNGKKSDESA